MKKFSENKSVRCVNTKTQRVKWFSPKYLSNPRNVNYLKYQGWVIDDPVQELEKKHTSKLKPVEKVIEIDEASKPKYSYPEFADITVKEIKEILENKKIEIPKYADKTTLYNLLIGNDEN